MKISRGRLMAAAFAASLLLGAAGCSTDPAALDNAANDQAAKEAAPKNKGTDKPAGKQAEKSGGDTNRDGAAMLLGSAFQGKARWEGDVLYVKTPLENGADNLDAVAACGMAQKILKDDTAVFFEFANGTFDCADAPAAAEAVKP